MTPTLWEFRQAEREDSNAWWRLHTGDMQNLYDEASEGLTATLDTLEALLIKAEAMWNAPMVNDVPADVLALLDARRAEREGTDG